MYTLDEIEDGQGILWKLFNIRHEELFTVSELWRSHSNENAEKDVSQKLFDKIMFIGTYCGCKKLTNIYGSHGSKKYLWKLNAVARVLKASPMKTVRDFSKKTIRNTTNSPWCSLSESYTSVKLWQQCTGGKFSIGTGPFLHGNWSRRLTEEHVQPDIQLQDMAIEGEETSSMVLKKGQLIAIRGWCYWAYSWHWFTESDPQEKVKGNILTLYSEDDVIVFQREEQWKGGNMLFAHVICTESDEYSAVEGLWVCHREWNILCWIKLPMAKYVKLQLHLDSPLHPSMKKQWKLKKIT